MGLLIGSLIRQLSERGTGDPLISVKFFTKRKKMSNKRLFSIILIVFIDLLGFSLILPLLPLLCPTFKASQTVTGLLIASYAVMQLIGAPILGRYRTALGAVLFAYQCPWDIHRLFVARFRQCIVDIIRQSHHRWSNGWQLEYSPGLHLRCHR